MTGRSLVFALGLGLAGWCCLFTGSALTCLIAGLDGWYTATAAGAWATGSTAVALLIGSASLSR